MTRIFQRLNLEALEDRLLLATCNVVRLGDFGAGGTMGSFSRGDLRFCTNQANDNPGPDTILIQVNGTINLTGALPDLASDMEIVGPGSSLLTIRRDTGGDYRPITVAGGSATISGVTIANGSADVGGGIYNQGTLNLNNVVVTSNTSTAGQGGGIYNSGVLEVTSSTISNNATIGSPDANGGGLYNAGTASISYSTISGNSVDATIACVNVNAIAHGGGISTSGTLTLKNSIVANNKARAASAPCFLPDSVAAGGGVYISSNSTTITNSTIAGNIANAWGGDQDYAFGGGISIENPGTLSITHSTIASNSAAEEAGSYSGSGLHASNGVTISVQNSIIAYNDYEDLSGNLTSSGYNLIGKSSGGSGYAPTDILNVDPLLGPLQDNGGPTQTMALLPGSPAIDAGDPNPADTPEWDQRGPGFPRIVNGRLDIGAFEVQATGAPSFDGLAVLVTADLDADERMTG